MPNKYSKYFIEYLIKSQIKALQALKALKASKAPKVTETLKFLTPCPTSSSRTSLSQVLLPTLFKINKNLPHKHRDKRSHKSEHRIDSLTIFLHSFSPVHTSLRHCDAVIEQHFRNSTDVEENPGPVADQRKQAQVLVTSYNVRGLNDPSKLRHLVNYLYKTDKGKEVDLIAGLQETYITNSNMLNYLWRGNLYLTPGNGNSCGCITFLSPHLNVIASRNIGDRAHVIVCQKTGETNAAYIVANIYAPNPNVNSKIEFFEKVLETISEFEESYSCSNSIVLGDFNLVFHSREAKNRNQSPQEKRVAAAVKDLIEANNLIDIWENKSSFTWKRANADTFSTIDRILFSKEILKVKSCSVNWSVSSSDHAAVEATFVFVNKPIKPRSRLVRIDPYISKSPSHSAQFVNNFNEMLATMPAYWDPHKKLEFAKVCIRSVAERIQAENKREFISEENAINEELNDTIDALSKVTLEGERRVRLIEQVEELRARKSLLIEEKGKRLAEKLGTKWYNEGEKSTKYFMRLLQRASPDDFKKLELENGIIISDSEGIKNEISTFYKKLYQNFDRVDKQVDNDFFNGIDPISGNNEDDVVKDITLEELRETLHTCSDSTPGPDGIPYSIIGLLWPSFGPLLVDAWNRSLVTGKLAPSHTLSYLKLIPKIGKNLAKLTNWRPITLSNCDHKLITKTYARRLCKNVSEKISGNQTAYLSSRLINDNIRSLASTIHLTNIEAHAKGLLVALDAKKAFDSVDHDYIERCLESFGCGRFVRIFKTLYADLKTDIIINGVITDGFYIRRGVKQGDPLSCIIFIMCMEPLLRNIEANNSIEPLHSTTLNSNLPKSYAYADDVNVTIKDSVENLQALFYEYERLSRMSNLELNADKTELLLLGDQPREKTYNVNYLGKNYLVESSAKVKINGILFQRDEQQMCDDNVQEVVKKIDRIFKQWSRRNMTTLGKILIVKTFGVSQAIYLFQSLTLNNAHFKTLNSILYKFIWNRHYLAAKAPERIKREIINAPIKLGGFGMLDIVALDESIKIKDLGRLLVTKHPYLSLVRRHIDLNQFFNPLDTKKVEEVTRKGIDLLRIDRDKLWSDSSLDRHNQLLRAIGDTDLKLVVSKTGLNSIPFYLIWRRGCRKINDLRNQDLRNLNRYIDDRKLTKIQTSIDTRAVNADREFLKGLLIRAKNFPIDKLSTKSIREARSTIPAITDFKLGLTLTNAESRSWSLKLSKVVSTRHKNLILRVAHGEIYTKKKLARFGLTNDPLCPRCQNVETLEHKFVTCQYVAKIWERVYAVTNHLTTSDPTLEDPTKAILGAYLSSTTTVLTINAEIMQRIHLLKDDANYLVHPRIFVKQAIIYLLKREKGELIKEELEFILDV